MAMPSNFVIFQFVDVNFMLPKHSVKYSVDVDDIANKLFLILGSFDGHNSDYLHIKLAHERKRK